MTILVGTNSSGKSTFLRTFPLIRQSVETGTSGPVLWFGQFVDFGSFRTSLSRNASDATIKLEFTIDIGKLALASPFHYIAPRTSLSDEKQITVGIHLVEHGSSRLNRISALEVEFGHRHARIEVASDGTVTSIRSNGTVLSSDKLALSAKAGIIPTIVSTGEAPSSLSPSYAPWHIKTIQEAQTAKTLNRKFLSSLLPLVSPWYHGNVKTQKKIHRLWRLTLGTPEEIYNQILANASSLQHLDRFYANPPNGKTMRTIADVLFAARLPDILTYADSHVSKQFLNVRYVGPVRARGERYYRIQEFSVDEIDPEGESLPIFLQSLSNEEIDDFNQFSSRFTGIIASNDSSADHLAVQVRETENPEAAPTNIVDVGFGFSQILPLALQLWSTFVRKPDESIDDEGIPATLVIEQPELHLHPRLQSRVADMIVSAITTAENRARSRRPSVVIETHSEVIVNRVGRLIRSKELAADDVAVYVFERATEAHSSNVRRARFDDDGGLLDWPFGFFSPEDIAVDILGDDDDDDDGAADEGAADEGAADEGAADEGAADESEADESEADEGEADESEADESEADESEADESEADESEADESEADEGGTDQNRRGRNHFN